MMYIYSAFFKASFCIGIVDPEKLLLVFNFYQAQGLDLNPARQVSQTRSSNKQQPLPGEFTVTSIMLLRGMCSIDIQVHQLAQLLNQVADLNH